MYLDPFVPCGIFQSAVLKEHLTELFQKYPGMSPPVTCSRGGPCNSLNVHQSQFSMSLAYCCLDLQFNLSTIFPLEADTRGTFCVRARLLREKKGGKTWTMIYLKFNEQHKIIQCEMFYDPAPLEDRTERGMIKVQAQPPPLSFFLLFWLGHRFY